MDEKRKTRHGKAGYKEKQPTHSPYRGLKRKERRRMPKPTRVT